MGRGASVVRSGATGVVAAANGVSDGLGGAALAHWRGTEQIEAVVPTAVVGLRAGTAVRLAPHRGGRPVLVGVLVVVLLVVLVVVLAAIVALLAVALLAAPLQPIKRALGGCVIPG
jgi:hypothetical protein